MDVLDLSGWALAAAMALAAGGATVRGFTGFGAALVWVSGLTLLIDPAEAVPVILFLGIITTFRLYPAARHDVEWETVTPLMAGAVIGTPIGTAVLASVDPRPMSLAISLVVLAAAFVLWRGFRLRHRPGTAASVAVGVTSGLLNGSTSASGPPVIVAYLASPSGAAVGRASMIAYFGAVGVAGVITSAIAGLVDLTVLARVMALTPAVLVGTVIGQRRFEGAGLDRVRTIGLVLLATLGIAGVIRSLAG